MLELERMLDEDQIRKEYPDIESSFEPYKKIANKEIKKVITEYLKERDKILDPVRLNKYPSHKSFNHTIKEDGMVYGGKRYRFTTCVLANLMVGDSLEIIKRIATWLEFYHLYTLHLDDWPDEDEKRRDFDTDWKAASKLYIWEDANEPTKLFRTKAIRYGVKCATYDALRLRDLAELSIQGATNINEAIREKLLGYLTHTDMFLVDGQDEDIDFEKMDVTEEEYDEMDSLKTGLLWKAAAKTGCTVGGGSLEQEKALDLWAIDFDHAFQPRDDLLGAGVAGRDLEESARIAEKIGKSASSDLEKGKKTPLYIIAKNSASPSQREILDKYYGKVTANDIEKIEALRRVFFETGAVVRVKQKIRENVERAMHALYSVDFVEEPRKALVDLTRIQLVREK